jgi:hypothetical protein
MNLMLGCGLCLLALVGSQAPGQDRKAAVIAQLAWLSGAWTGDKGTLEERWTPPAGGAMLGVSRTVKGGRMVAFEFLRIVERDGTLVYIAQPEGRPPTEFTLTRLDGEQATFENPAHDFPQVIRYAKRPDGGLEATISGAGGRDAQTYRFQPARDRPALKR